MGLEIPVANLYRFGLFEADARNGRLLRHGARVKIQDQPFRVLLVLLRRAGEIVTRDELRQELWASDTYVEFDGSLNAALKKLRYALGDSADNPSFIETVPKRGYRFIAPVEKVYPQPPRSAVPVAKHIGRDPGSSEPETLGEMPGSPRGNGTPGPSLGPVPELRPPEPALLPLPARGQAPSRLRVAKPAVAIAAVACVGAAVYSLLPVPPPRVLHRVQLTHFGRAASAMGMETDGARIYFSEVQGGRYTIDQVSVSGGEPTPFPLPFAKAEVLDISPDHTELLVASFTGFEGDEALWVAPVTGGAPRRLGDAVGSSGAWSPDGQTIAYCRGTELYAVRRDGNAAARRIVGVPAAAQLQGVRWSPSGRTLRFTVVKATTSTLSQWEVAADGSNLHPLYAKPEAEAGAGDGLGRWTPDGRYFVYNSFEGSEWSIRATREFGSILRRVNRNPVQIYSDPHGLSAPLPSIDGKRIYLFEDQERRELVRYDSASRQFVSYLSGIFARDVSFSKDGERVVYTFSPPFEVWSGSLDGSDRRPLTFPPMNANRPRFSPDGRQVVFGAWGPAIQPGFYLLPVEGGSKPEQILAAAHGGVMGWSPDGRSLLVWQETGSGAPLGLYAVDLRSRQSSLLLGSETLHHGSVSPDGLRVAALTEDAKSVVLYDLQTHQKSEIARGAALYSPCWSHDGKAVFFQDIFQGPDQPIYRVEIVDHRVERITNLAQPLAADVAGYRLAGITPDDQVLASLIRSNSDLYALDVDFP
jgi:DNA-binding winged helix-turn-helix (wHTH) protein/Tol biopolymer transport system component